MEDNLFTEKNPHKAQFDLHVGLQIDFEWHNSADHLLAVEDFIRPS